MHLLRLNFSKHMKKVLLLFFFGVLLLNFWGCVPPEFNEKSFSSSKLDFNDKNIQNIFNLLERQSTDSIVALLHDQNPQYRLCALQALASLRAKSTLDSVSKLLDDKYNSVRCQAAFVLGQIGDVRAENFLLDSYTAHDTTPEGFVRNAAILEAIGKCGSLKSLNYLCQISTFRPTDTVLITEQARAVMRFSLRDSFTTQSNKKLLAFTTPNQNSEQIRLAAAFGLSREKISFDTIITNAVIKNLLIEPSADVRIFLAKILGKSAEPKTTVEAIANSFRLETNTNVKIALLNACQSVHFDAMRDMVQPLLTDKNEHLSQAAAQFFKNLSTSKALPTIREVLNSNDILPATRYTLWAAIMKQYSFSPRLRDSIANILIDLFNKETNTFDKVRILRALETSPYNYDFFEEQALNTNNALPVRSQAAQSLSDIFLSPTFNTNFRGFSISIRNRLAATMLKFIGSSDAGLAAIGALAIQSPQNGINKLGLQDNISMMYQAIQKFKSPNDLEAIENIRDAINYIADSVASKKPKIKTGKVIDWSTLRTLSNYSTATVYTTHGSFKFQLLLQEAPISVINFVTLARSGFFNNKAWHRVVPLHVIQTGCPRGDGYGSLDYTISTEIGSETYNQAGFVGMARADLHTECSQWFVTTVPTLHLDGNYSIFGKVIDGQNVVNTIVIGDTVERIVID